MSGKRGEIDRLDVRLTRTTCVRVELGMKHKFCFIKPLAYQNFS